MRESHCSTLLDWVMCPRSCPSINFMAAAIMQSCMPHIVCPISVDTDPSIQGAVTATGRKDGAF